MVFVADEVLVDRQDRRLIDEIARLGAEVMPERPLLPPPPGMRPRELSGDFPTPVRLRFSRPPRVKGAVQSLTSLLDRRSAIWESGSAKEADTSADVRRRHCGICSRLGIRPWDSGSAAWRVSRDFGCCSGSM